MRMLVWSLFAVCVFPIGPAEACDGAFREPGVNFAGIATWQQMEDYKGEVSNKISDQQTHILDCYMAANDAARNAGDWARKDEQNRIAEEESNRWLADSTRFISQLDQAGKAHLALVAAQPFKGAYNDSAMKTTGGAAASRATPKATANPAPSSSGTSRSNEYSPIEGCLTAKNGADNFGKISRITNSCDEALEAIWTDTKGGKNSVTVGAGSYFQGGNPVRLLWACRKNDGLRLVSANIAVCHH